MNPKGEKNKRTEEQLTKVDVLVQAGGR